MARRSNYTRLLRWWLDAGYSLGDLTGQEVGGGVRVGDYVEFDRKTPRGADMRINVGGMTALTEYAKDLQGQVRAQAEAGHRFHLPAVHGDDGRFEAWKLSANGEHNLRQELVTHYRDVKVEIAPPSLRVHPQERQGAPMIRIEGVGRGSIRSPQSTRWGDVLKERQTKLTREIRAADKATSTKRTAPARERAAEQARELRAEREAVKRDRRHYR